MTESESSRRPIKTRQAKWAQRLAVYLKNKGVIPNMISVASVGFALLAFICLFSAPRISNSLIASFFWLFAAGAIQARLICNLIDGMVAVEGGLKTPSGPVYNDLPDRLADPLIIVGLGYALPTSLFDSASIIPSVSITLGWIAAMLAVLTAYIRLLGGSCGLPQSFSGPLAKQQRMAICTFVAVIAAFLPNHYLPYLILIALAILVVGTALTAIFRTQAIIALLNQVALNQAALNKQNESLNNKESQDV